MGHIQTPLTKLSCDNLQSLDLSTAEETKLVEMKHCHQTSQCSVTKLFYDVNAETGIHKYQKTIQLYQFYLHC